MSIRALLADMQILGSDLSALTPASLVEHIAGVLEDVMGGTIGARMFLLTFRTHITDIDAHSIRDILECILILPPFIYEHPME